MKKMRSQPTYEGLKRQDVGQVLGHLVRSQPTYEGLKLPGRWRPARRVQRSQPTYEGLKRNRRRGRKEKWPGVPSLPMRD